MELKRKRGLTLGGKGSVADTLAPENKNTAEAEIDCDLIDNNPRQPRRTTKEETLKQLAATIDQHGLMQPIVVREGEGGRFFLVAGQRRLAAHRLLGKAKILATVTPSDNKQSMALALIENMNREDLSPLDEAVAIKDYMNECELTQAAAAESLGISARYISELLGLTTLPAEIMQLAEKGIATTLKPLTELRKAHSLDPNKTLEFIKDKDQVSVRDIQNFVDNIKEEGNPAQSEKPQKDKTTPAPKVAAASDAAPASTKQLGLVEIISEVLEANEAKQIQIAELAKELASAVHEWKVGDEGVTYK